MTQTDRAMTDVHELIDAYAERLHRLADLAHSVQRELPGDTADDPRVEAEETELGRVGRRLNDAMEHATGVGAPVGQTYDAAGDEPCPELVGTGDFHLQFDVVPPESADDDFSSAVLDVLDRWGPGIAASLAEAGYEVPFWASFEELEDADELEDPDG